MLVIGSRALQYHGILQEGRVPNDWDFICTFKEFQSWCKENKSIIRHCVPLADDKFHVIDSHGVNYEFEIAWPWSSGEDLLLAYDATHGEMYADLQTLLVLKLSHRYLKDSVHFLKTMRDIQHLRSLKISLAEGDTFWHKWLSKREKETYVYNHPKLNVTKEGFFKGDGVQYVYDHDSIHLTIALTEEWKSVPCPDKKVGCMVAHRRAIKIPAYTFYMKDGAQVMTSKEKFFMIDEDIRLYGVYEEACVLALERSQIPYDFKPEPRWSFEMALMKVCTSITSGWFRCWAYEHYDEVVALYERLGEDDYIKRFEMNKHLLKPHIEGNSYGT